MVWTGKLALPARDQPITPESMSELSQASVLTEAPLCSTCGKPKEWFPCKTGKRRGYWKCKPCRNRYSQKHYNQNEDSARHRARTWKQLNYDSERQRWINIKSTFGITKGQYEKIEKAQGGVCAVCGQPPSGNTKNQQVLAIDHCHATGQIRGLLCGRCNKALGLFNDDALRLQKAIRYLNGGNADLISSVLHPAHEASEHGGASDAGSDADTGVSGERAEA
jgi:hypothetical protein